MPEAAVGQPHAHRLGSHPQEHCLVAKCKPRINHRLQFHDQVHKRLHPLAWRGLEVLEDHLPRRLAAEGIGQRQPRTGQIDTHHALRVRGVADQWHEPADPSIAQLLRDDDPVEAAARGHDQLAGCRQEPEPRRPAEPAAGGGQIERPHRQLSLEESHRHLSGRELEAGDLRGGPRCGGIDRKSPQSVGDIRVGTDRRGPRQRQRDTSQFFSLGAARRRQPVVGKEQRLVGVPCRHRGIDDELTERPAERKRPGSGAGQTQPAARPGCQQPRHLLPVIGHVASQFDHAPRREFVDTARGRDGQGRGLELELVHRHPLRRLRRWARHLQQKRGTRLAPQRNGSGTVPTLSSRHFSRSRLRLRAGDGELTARGLHEHVHADRRIEDLGGTPGPARRRPATGKRRGHEPPFQPRDVGLPLQLAANPVDDAVGRSAVHAWVSHARTRCQANLSPRRQHGQTPGPQRERRREEFGRRDLHLPCARIPLARRTYHGPRLTDLPTVDLHSQLFHLAAGPRDLPAAALRRQRRRGLRKAAEFHALEDRRRQQPFPPRLPTRQVSRQGTVRRDGLRPRRRPQPRFASTQAIGEE